MFPKLCKSTPFSSPDCIIEFNPLEKGSILPNIYNFAAQFLVCSCHCQKLYSVKISRHLFRTSADFCRLEKSLNTMQIGVVDEGH